MSQETPKNITTRLRKKYELKADTPFEKLSKIMTPTDHKDFIQAIKYPNGKTNSPDQFINQKEKNDET
tara:strand:+ start:173 stop:376 length:204 start_codon:yes stop_codon:yes gene_type:complete